MIFGWFDARPAREFGSELASAFVALVPIDGATSDRRFEAKVKSAMSQLGRRVADFRRNRHLNTYQKAQLGNTFKWTLKDAGYDAAYVDKLTDWLVLQLQ